jgi:hypothetical protein
MLSQIQKCLETFRLEDFEVLMLNSTHCINHVLPDLDRRRVRFGVPS